MVPGATIVTNKQEDGLASSYLYTYTDCENYSQGQEQEQARK